MNKIVIVIPESYHKAGISDVSFIPMRNKILSEQIYDTIEYLFWKDVSVFSVELRDKLHSMTPSGVILIGHTSALGVPKVTVNYQKTMNLDWVYAIPKLDWVPKSDGYLLIPEIGNIPPAFWVSRITPERWGGGAPTGCWDIRYGVERYIRRRSLFPQIGRSDKSKIPLVIRLNYCENDVVTIYSNLSGWHNLPGDSWYNDNLTERNAFKDYKSWDYVNHFDKVAMSWNEKYKYQANATKSLRLNQYGVWIGHGNKFDFANYAVDYMVGNFEHGYESVQIANSCNSGTPSLAKKVGEGSLCVAANVLNWHGGNFNKLGVMVFIGVGADSATVIDPLIPQIPLSKSIGEAVMKAFSVFAKMGIPASENPTIQLNILGDGSLPI